MKGPCFSFYKFLALALLAGGLQACSEDATERADQQRVIQQIHRELRAAADSDPVIFHRVSPVQPTVRCVDRLAGNQFRAHFGYANRSANTVTIPVGSFNRFQPGRSDRGQPTSFAPGSQADVIQVPFGGFSQSIWALGSHYAIATKFSKPCPVRGAGGNSGVGGDLGSGGAAGVGGARGAGGDTGLGGATGIGGDAGLGGNIDAGGDTGLGGSTGAGGAFNVLCDECAFGLQPDQPDLCSSSANGCFNCDPESAGCEDIADPDDKVLCREAYACLVAQSHPDSSVPGPCLIGGDPLSCWCGTKLDVCSAEANGPCLQQALAASRSTDPSGILQRFLDPTNPLGRAVNLATCHASYCASSCSLPWFEPCTASDACHSPGIRDPLTLVCSDPVGADGVGCDDSDRSTVSDRCYSGICRGVPVEALACQQCTFGYVVGGGQPDICSATDQGCGNCSFLPPCYFLPEPEASQCQSLYACLVAPTHPESSVPGGCMSLGDPSPCFCGTDETCLALGAPASQANGPCLQLLRDFKLATDSSILNFDFYFDPSTVVGQATNLASCQSFSCAPECGLPF